MDEPDVVGVLCFCSTFSTIFSSMLLCARKVQTESSSNKIELFVTTTELQVKIRGNMTCDVLIIPHNFTV